MEMEEQQNNIEESGGMDVQFHPLVDGLMVPSKAYFDKMDHFSHQWDDVASDQFKEEVVERCRKTSLNFLKATVSLTDGYEQLLQEAQSLLKCTAGFGRALSIIDLEMLADRQLSRWLFGRDDQRW